MKKSILSSLFILLFVLLSQTSFSQLFNEDVYKFGKALNYITSYYVDTVNRSELAENALIGMLKDLDPHSVYMSKEEVKKINEPLQGNFEGVGIQFNILNDTLYVISPISGGPSEKVGVMAGDRIVKIDNEIVAGVGLTTKGVKDRLLGEKGTKVEIEVKRKGMNEPLKFVIIRDKIPIYCLDAAYVVNNDIGYIKLNRFAITTHEEFNKAANKLIQKGANNLILDLRDNGGGYLEMAIRLADEFLEKEKMIVYTEGSKTPKTENFSTENGLFIDGNIAILIDEGSASASEIVAGAIQDWDRGVIIGRRSFGKGLVQRPLMLPDGSMIRLTIARYHTPTGRVIQKSYSDGNKKYSHDLFDRYKHGELLNKDSIEFPDSLEYRTLKNNRIVYGGGGIMPDIFIPIDTSAYPKYYSKLIRQGIINKFILDYIDKNRKNIEKQYPKFEKYNKKFSISDEMMDELSVCAKNDGIEKDKHNHDDVSIDNIKLLLKALIARDIWDMSEYFQIINQEDKGFIKAIDVLENWDDYKKEILK
ncbi:MAG: S41 family peptidase [Bacteroidota bacterium]|nr:S41 family peptidase [Bacteroidota bacterium]